MSAYTFTITKAEKKAVPPLIALWGMSGSGKTMSALLLARGIVGEKGKIVVIDTENGRANYYADTAKDWLHMDIQPPFTPEKYSAAFKFAEEQGADIIIVDSMSHVWEGEGGVLDMAENAKSAKGYDLKGLAKWKAPKTQYKRMFNNLLRSPIPVIFCVRAKEKFVQEKDEKGYDTLRSDGYVPIMDKNFVYEMLVSLRMLENGTFAPISTKDSKIPDFLRGVFDTASPVSVEMGKKLMSIMGEVTLSEKELINLKRSGTDAATQGTEVFREWWKGLSKQEQSSCAPFVDGWKVDCENADNLFNQEEGELNGN